MTDLFAPRLSADQRARAALIKARVKVHVAAEAMGLAPKGDAARRWDGAIVCPLCRKAGGVDIILGGYAFLLRCCSTPNETLGGDVIIFARLDARYERFAAACAFLERLSEADGGAGPDLFDAPQTDCVR